MNLPLSQSIQKTLVSLFQLEFPLKILLKRTEAQPLTTVIKEEPRKALHFYLHQM